MRLRDYLSVRGVHIDGLCGSSFSQARGSFSDVDYDLDTSKLVIYIQEQYGRFGNNVHQVLHALIVARGLDIKNICCSFYIDDKRTNTIIIGDILVKFGVQQVPDSPQISATMFELQGFENFIHNFDYDSVKLDAERISRILFGNNFEESRNWSAKVCAFHFRSGDIFGTFINSIYTQPPLSYYVKALDHILETFQSVDIRLVYEDELNPCIEQFKGFLRRRGLAYQAHSSSFYEDAKLLISADCIVASYSSFCDVLALMNENLSRWYAFRSIAAYEGIDLSLARDFSRILRSSGVEVYKIIDEKNSYTALGDWVCSPSQLHQLVNYPLSNLSIRSICNPIAHLDL